MGASDLLILAVTRPLEFRTLLQFKLWHDMPDITLPSVQKYTGWNRPTMRKCWDFLDLTSRSFASVIKQLEGDLARVVRGRHDC